METGPNADCIDFAFMETDAAHDSAMHRPRLLATLFWIAVFLAGALSNVIADALDAWRQAQPFDWWPPLVGQGTSIAASLLLLPGLLAAVRRWPIQWDNWRRRLPLYVLGSVAWTLLHVAGMVALRTLVHAAMGAGYDYGPWASNLVYEFSKDARDFFLIASGVHAFDWFQRQRQGEAHALASPDPGVPPVPELASARPRRFVVRKLGRDFLIDVDDIDRAQANGNYVNLHVAGRVYPMRSTMAALEALLDPSRFVRVHRSHLVNLARVASIEPLDSGDARVHLRDGTIVACSRRHRDALHRAPG